MSRSRADATMRIRLDDREAHAGFDRLEQRARSLGDTMGQAPVNRFNEALKVGQERVEKAATAVTGLSSVMGGLGSSTGAALGAISNLASAVVVGGPLLGGFSLAATAMSHFAARASHAREEARKLAHVQSDRLARSMERVRDLTTEASDAVRDFGRSAAQMRLDTVRREIDAARNDVDFRQRALGALNDEFAKYGLGSVSSIEEGRRQFSRLTGGSGLIARQFGMSERDVGVLRTVLEIAERARSNALAARRELVELQKAEKDALEALQRDETEKAGRGAGKQRALEFEETAPGLFGQRDTGLTVDDRIAFARDGAGTGVPESMRARAARRQAAIDAAAFSAALLEADMAAALRAEDEGNKARAEKAKESARELERITKKRHEEELRSAKQAAEEERQFKRQVAMEVASFTTSVLSAGLQSWLTIVEAGIRRQKVDFAAMIGGFIRQTGQQIFAIGVKYAVEGAGMIAMSGGVDPRGYATAAVGAGGMAVGASMATAGTAISAAGAMRGGAAGGGGVGGGAPRSVAGAGFSGRQAAPIAGEGNISIHYHGGVHYGDTSSDRQQALRRDQAIAMRETWVPEGA